MAEFVEKTVEEIDAMTDEELLQYEDELAAADAGETIDPGDADPEPSDDKGTAAADPPAAEGDPDGDDPPAAKAGDDDGGEGDAADPPAGDPAPEPATPDEDLTKHISPPSKWAEQRRERTALKIEAEELRAKAEKAEALEAELAEVKQKMDWVTETMKSKGIDLPTDPLEAISEESIADIREEHGDTMADLVTALRASIQRLTPATSKPAAAEPATEPPAAEPTQPPAAPPADPAPAVNPEVLKAIDENDSLSWWRKESPKLWAMAVAKDEALSADPEYLKLSFTDRYAKVVEEVTKDVTKPAPSPSTNNGDSPPASLSTSTGVAPEPTENDALRKLESIEDPAKQQQYYESLPEKVRDQVDLALGI